MAHQLNLAEREIVACMWWGGSSRRQIGLALGRDPTTIGRELRRNGCRGHYQASHAQQSAEQRRCQAQAQRCKMTRPEVAQYVQAHLSDYWSPEQIAGRMKLDFPENSRLRISYQTIYHWLAQSDHGRWWRRYLRRWRPRRRRRRAQHQKARTVRHRPEVINRRERYGDWEGDTIVGPRSQGPVLVSLVERRSGFLELARAVARKSRHVIRVMLGRFRAYPQDLTRSATFDNGCEFADAQKLETSLQMAVFFADPRAPYQRGSNENTNGLVRQFIPKGTGLSQISRHKVAQIQELLNHRPRKRLGYKTPHEVMREERYRAFQT